MTKFQGQFKYYLNNEEIEDINDLPTFYDSCSVDGDKIYFYSSSAPKKENKESKITSEDNGLTFIIEYTNPQTIEDLKNFKWVNPVHWSRSTTNGKTTEETVHSNPFVDESYSPRKKRLEDVEKENSSNKKAVDSWQKMVMNNKDKIEQRLKEDDWLQIYPTDRDADLDKFKENYLKAEKELAKKKKPLEGIKGNQTEQKAPIFTYCKVNKNALEALANRALYGHNKYNIDGADEDWQNFTRVPNGDFEYANAQFRHALGIGGEETEEEHLISSAWNAIARLEIYLRKKDEK